VPHCRKIAGVPGGVGTGKGVLTAKPRLRAALYGEQASAEGAFTDTGNRRIDSFTGYSHPKGHRE